RLYGYFLRFSISRALALRVNFWLRIVMDIVYYAVGIGFYKLLYMQTPSLAGWSEAEAMVFITCFLVVDAIHMMLYSTNLWNLAGLVNQGGLDYYLVRPVSSLFFVSLREFSFSSFVNFLMAAGLLAWALNNFPGSISAAQILNLLFLILNGAVIYYVIFLLFVVPVFWIHSNFGLMHTFFAAIHLAERPDPIFGGFLRVALITLVPFALIASYPARIIIDGASIEITLHCVAGTVFLMGVLLFVWNKALASYSSASS
ncbi:MAG: hypothetical protein DCC75_09095, partial [Proteobacteria bacterium]